MDDGKRKRRDAVLLLEALGRLSTSQLFAVSRPSRDALVAVRGVDDPMRAYHRLFATLVERLLVDRPDCPPRVVRAPVIPVPVRLPRTRMPDGPWSRIPWVKYTDGQTYELRRGEHFTNREPHAVYLKAWQYGKRHGFKCQGTIVDSDTVLIRFTEIEASTMDKV